MKKIILLLLFIVTYSLFAETPKEIANKVLEDFTTAKYKEVAEKFDTTLTKLLKPDMLETTWKQLVEVCGNFKKIDENAKEQQVLKYNVVYQKLIFENVELKAEISIDKDNKVAGFRLIPVESKEEYVDAEYVRKAQFEEVDVVVSKDEIIKGKLTLPNSAKTQKVPAVVLVHGSGPNDKDETIFKSKPFRDIAYGLASNDIAVLRYDKRTFADKNIDVKTITMNEETVYDAVAAVELLNEKYNDKISKIYVLGHSQGGYMLPRIAKKTNAAKGFISLAGPARPLEELIEEQIEYILYLPENNLTEEQKQTNREKMEEIKVACKRVKNKDYNINTPNDSLPFGIGAKYWEDLIDYNPVTEFQSEKRPMLFIQGGRDYQVTEKDFNLWKNKLNKPKNKFLLFNDLNHLMQKGEGIATPQEYMEKGYVDERIINSIIIWIKENE